jgi:hypothetical protein
MLGKIAPLIRYFVERVPGAGRTQIVKFLYLTDLESGRYLGHPISDLNYILYDHGPFDSEILAHLDLLCAMDYLEGEQVRYPNGKFGWRYKATDKPLPLTGTSKEGLAILDYVAANYGRTPLQGLLEEVVYQTAPMVDAKEREAYGHRLRMELVDNEARVPGLELERVVASVDQLDQGGGRSLKEIVAKQR